VGFNIASTYREVILIIKAIVAFILIALAGQALAIYKCTDSTGKMTFQDKACNTDKTQANVRAWKDAVADDPNRDNTQQKKICKSIGSVAEAVVDLYISGTSRSEALQQARTERQRAVMNSVYDRLENFGTIRNEATRTSIKATESLKAEVDCLQSISSK
jgi:hypothetical protein